MSVKVPEPKRFNGDSQKIDNWLYQLRLYFQANDWQYDGDDSQRCAAFAAALLEGPAL